MPGDDLKPPDKKILIELDSVLAKIFRDDLMILINSAQDQMNNAEAGTVEFEEASSVFRSAARFCQFLTSALAKADQLSKTQ